MLKKKGFTRALIFEEPRLRGKDALAPLQNISRDFINTLPKETGRAAKKLRGAARKHPLIFLGGSIGGGIATLTTGLPALGQVIFLAGVGTQLLLNSTKILARKNLQRTEQVLEHLKAAGK